MRDGLAEASLKAATKRDSRIKLKEKTKELLAFIESSCGGEVANDALHPFNHKGKISAAAGIELGYMKDKLASCASAVVGWCDLEGVKKYIALVNTQCESFSLNRDILDAAFSNNEKFAYMLNMLADQIQTSPDRSTGANVIAPFATYERRAEEQFDSLVSFVEKLKKSGVENPFAKIFLVEDEVTVFKVKCFSYVDCEEIEGLLDGALQKQQEEAEAWEKQREEGQPRDPFENYDPDKNPFGDDEVGDEGFDFGDAFGGDQAGPRSVATGAGADAGAVASAVAMPSTMPSGGVEETKQPDDHQSRLHDRGYSQGLARQ